MRRRRRPLNRCFIARECVRVNGKAVSAPDLFNRACGFSHGHRQHCNVVLINVALKHRPLGARKHRQNINDFEITHGIQAK